MASNFGYDVAYQPSGVDGTTVTSSGSSASATIPNAADGNRARFVRLMVTGNLYVQFGKTTATATTSSMLLSPNFDVIISCKQFDKIAYLQEAVAAKLNITPLEA